MYPVVEYLFKSGSYTRAFKKPPTFEVIGEDTYIYGDDTFQQKLKNGDTISVVWTDTRCLARTKYGEQCQKPARHDGKHVFTSSADGASISWEDVR